MNRRTFIQTIAAVLAGLGLGVKVAAEPKPAKDPWEGQRYRAGLSSNHPQHQIGEVNGYLEFDGKDWVCNRNLGPFEAEPYNARYYPGTDTIEFNNALDVRIANEQERHYQRMVYERINPPIVLHKDGTKELIANSYLDPLIKQLGEKLGKPNG